MTNVGGSTNIKEAQSRNMINICTKYGFDILIISGSTGAPKLINSDLLLKKHATIPIKSTFCTYCSMFSHKQITFKY